VNNTVGVTLPTTPGTVSVSWGDLLGGSPTAVADPTELLGFIWQFSCVQDGACAVDVILDDLEFVE
jgi:hypothetical protein